MTDVTIRAIAPTRTNVKYGWLPDLPDNRDHVATLNKAQARRVTRLASKVDLRLTPYEPPIYDQSALGSCTANGVGDIFEFTQRRQGLTDYMPSRLFIYYEERKAINTISYDSGAFIRDGLKVVNKLGAAHENLWPYDISRFTWQPGPEVYADALNHQALEYAAVDNRIQRPIKEQLALGFPVVFGFTVYSWFEAINASGVGTPVANQQVLGGHCTVIVGYEHLPISRRLYFIVRNSWGTAWGDHGYCYLPAYWLCDYYNADDFWVIRQVEADAPATLRRAA